LASIYQSIEILSKEKGIDPQIVLDAVKDAMLAAARKHFRSQEDLLADLTSIIYSFCARLYGQRRAKRKTEKIVQELEDKDATG